VKNRPLCLLTEDEIVDRVRGYLPHLSNEKIRNHVRVLLGICTTQNVLIMRAEPSDFKAIQTRKVVNWYV